MTTETIQDGDIVILVSGGPLMTAEPSMRCDGIIPVSWFAGDDLRKDAFPAICLKLMGTNREAA